MSAAAVAQSVERGKTGLGKDLSSNPKHLISALLRVRVPSRQRLSNGFPSQSTALLWINRVFSITSLAKDFHSNQNV